MADCSAIKTQLDAKQALYDRLIQPGVRVVQDADGSRIEYSLPNVNALREQVALLQAQYDRCLNSNASGPFNFVF